MVELIAAAGGRGGGGVIKGSVGAGGGLGVIEARSDGEAGREAAGPRDEKGRSEAGREGPGAAEGGGGHARGRRRADRRHPTEELERESSRWFFSLEDRWAKFF